MSVQMIAFSGSGQHAACRLHTLEQRENHAQSRDSFTCVSSLMPHLWVHALIVQKRVTNYPTMAIFCQNVVEGFDRKSLQRAIALKGQEPQGPQAIRGDLGQDATTSIPVVGRLPRLLGHRPPSLPICPLHHRNAPGQLFA
jgi:hypothetical protein